MYQGSIADQINCKTRWQVEITETEFIDNCNFIKEGLNTGNTILSQDSVEFLTIIGVTTR